MLLSLLKNQSTQGKIEAILQHVYCQPRNVVGCLTKAYESNLLPIFTRVPVSQAMLAEVAESTIAKAYIDFQSGVVRQAMGGVIRGRLENFADLNINLNIPEVQKALSESVCGLTLLEVLLIKACKKSLGPENVHGQKWGRHNSNGYLTLDDEVNLSEDTEEYGKIDVVEPDQEVDTNTLRSNCQILGINPNGIDFGELLEIYEGLSQDEIRHIGYKINSTLLNLSGFSSTGVDALSLEKNKKVIMCFWKSPLRLVL